MGITKQELIEREASQPEDDGYEASCLQADEDRRMMLEDAEQDSLDLTLEYQYGADYMKGGE